MDTTERLSRQVEYSRYSVAMSKTRKVSCWGHVMCSAGVVIYPWWPQKIAGSDGSSTNPRRHSAWAERIAEN